jgi:hypothetical protein
VARASSPIRQLGRSAILQYTEAVHRGYAATPETWVAAGPAIEGFESTVSPGGATVDYVFPDAPPKRIVASSISIAGCACRSGICRNEQPTLRSRGFVPL